MSLRENFLSGMKVFKVRNSPSGVYNSSPNRVLMIDTEWGENPMTNHLELDGGIITHPGRDVC
jgi:hypothetical protein